MNIQQFSITRWARCLAIAATVGLVMVASRPAAAATDDRPLLVRTPWAACCCGTVTRRCCGMPCCNSPQPRESKTPLVPVGSDNRGPLGEAVMGQSLIVAHSEISKSGRQLLFGTISVLSH